jgi:hypothetical protein
MFALFAQDTKTMKVTQAIERLSSILPIKARLDALPGPSARIYQAVVNGFYQQGRAPTLEELAQLESGAEAIVAGLAEQDMLTLDDDGQVKGCYPFTMEQRVHRIHINGHTVHAMCALDALAPSAMFECPSSIDSQCAVTNEPVHVELDNLSITNPEQVNGLHFGINWAAASSCCSCSDSLCTEMLFLKDEAIAKQWMEDDAENREIFGLVEAIEFSAGFFKPMMRQG